MSIKTLTEEDRENIKALYMENKLTYKEIAFKIGQSTTCVSEYIRRAIDRGDFPRQERKKNARPNARGKSKKRNGLPKPDGKVVNCTAAVAAKCIYGAKSPDYLCDFFAVTGTSTRLPFSPDHTKCTCFTSKKNL